VVLSFIGVSGFGFRVSHVVQEFTMSRQGYVAFDLGAESGRAMLAILETERDGRGGRLTLEEAHRFPTEMLKLPSGYHWNLTGLFAQLLVGLRRCHEMALERGVELVSLGVDTWGVDYALIGKSGQLLGLPFAYRDERNIAAMDQALKALGDQRIYDATGIQFMRFNTLYQLVADRDREPEVLRAAARMLNIPDVLHYFFSGVMANEATIASTTQMVDPRPGPTGVWARDLLESLQLPTGMLADIVPAGTKIGTLRADLAMQLGVPATIDVVTPGSHDTASAVAAVPTDTGSAQHWAYISSGTWSLLGAELDEPLLSDASRQASFTNERGVAGKIRYLKNIAGLWLVQECRRAFEAQGHSYDYGTLTHLAGESQPLRTLIDPAHAPFALPGRMPQKIADFAKATGQPVPETPGQLVRCCLESLALTYRHTLDRLEKLLGKRMEVLHIVGGGGRNGLLNQLTADAIGRPVVVGPYEATAIGNALTQALGRGDLADLSALRRVVRDSFPVTTCTPAPGSGQSGIAAALPRYLALLGK
jgi:rhamnulokinase